VDGAAISFDSDEGGGKHVETQSERHLRLLFNSTGTSPAFAATAKRVVQGYCVPRRRPDGVGDGVNNTSRTRKARVVDAVKDDFARSIFEELFVVPAGEEAKSRTADFLPAQQQAIQSRSFRLDLAYDGSPFCGWQRQEPKRRGTQNGAFRSNDDSNRKRSVQECVEEALARTGLFGEGDAPDVRVCGRTDAGVHAVGQVARVRLPRSLSLCSPQRPVSSFPTANDIYDALAALRDEDTKCDRSWRCLRVSPESDKFHPSFGALSRSYLYLIDANPVLVRLDGCDGRLQRFARCLDRMLRLLEGRTLSYDGMSYGKLRSQSSLCTLTLARTYLLGGCCLGDKDDGAENRQVIAIALTSDRFLRRMVRIVVATALQLAFEQDLVDPSNASGCDDDHPNDEALLNCILSCDRRLSAKAAPPDGLIFVGAKFKPSTVIRT